MTEARLQRALVPPPALPHAISTREEVRPNDLVTKVRSRFSLLGAPLRLRQARRVAEAATALESEIVKLDDAALTASAKAFGAALRRGGMRGDALVRTIAIVREAARRRIGMTPFVEQLIAGYALLRGAVVEMDTGEGKTLTSLVPCCLHALSGRFVHVVTPSDYLAERDGNLLRPALESLGISVGIVVHEMSPADRRAAYACDVTFVSNKEVAFDYLRDRLVTEGIAGDRNVSHKVQKALGGLARTETLLRGLDVAIVDEIDSVLIDDAGTPLLISAPAEATVDPATAAQAAEIAAALEPGADFRLDPHGISADLTGRGETRIDELAAGLPGPWRQRIRRHEIVRSAIAAYRGLQRDRHYLVRDDRVVIIDENTGRTMPDRYWGHDLHLMVEFKEGCTSSGLRKSLASTSFQRFFRSYRTLAGMSGTVREVAVELSRIYSLPLIRVPRRKPLRREYKRRRLFANRERLWREAARTVEALHKSGRPVLIGVRTVGETDRASRALAAAGVPFTVLSAAQDKHEAEIVAEAGRRGAVTIATNMAGRGTDIKLGDGVAAAGGLAVVICERHDYRRIDRQLMGRCARQGDPGTVYELVSMEDPILRFAGRWLRPLMRAPLLGRLATALAFREAQWHAERVQALRRIDLVMRDEQLRKVLAFAGGLD